MNLIHLNLRDIFTSGTFGPVHLGMTIPELIELIGKPGSTHDFDVDQYLTKILFYGSYEFKFQNFYDESGVYKLAGIQNDSTKYLGAIEEGFDPEKIILDPWFFKNELNYKEVTDALKKEEFSYVVEEKHDVLLIIFPNKSDIFFERSITKKEWACWGWSLNSGFF